MEELTDEQIFSILQEYRVKKFRESCIGPSISLLFHIVLLLLLSFLVLDKKNEINKQYEVEIVQLKEKEIDKKIEVEIEEVKNEKVDIPDPVSFSQSVSPEMTNEISVEDNSNDVPETEDNLEMEDVLDVINNPTPLKMSGLYGGRTKSGIISASKKYGATNAGQDSVDRALTWLAKVQLENGSWENNPAHSGLALLCFLAHGETPLSDTYGVTVQKSIQWLATNMPENNMWNRAYSHAIATYAIAEAYGVTQIPFLVSPMESGIEVILKGQQSNGGFDYYYKKGERWDVSVTGWQMQAMKAAYIAGSTNPNLQNGIEKVISFMKSSAYSNSKFGYTSSGNGSQNMTGIGNVGLQLLGEGQSKEVVESSKWIFDNRTKSLDEALINWESGSSHLYGWYYDTQAIFQFYNNKKEWDIWKNKFQTLLVRNQHQEGYWTFTKDSHGIGGDTLSGKILSTTLCCLQLEVFYRYLPTFKINHGEVTQNKNLNSSTLIIK